MELNNVKFMHRLGKLAIGCCTACNRVHYIRGWCHVIGAVSWSLTDGTLKKVHKACHYSKEVVILDLTQNIEFSV